MNKKFVYKLSRYICIHKDKVADTTSHDEQMEDFMGAEIFVMGVEDGEFQRIDHAAYSVDDAACQEP